MKMKIDLHLHSKYSWDSKVEISAYIKKAEKLGFSAISITDHNDTRSHKEIEKLQEMTSVFLIPGQEVSTKDGHLLIYGAISSQKAHLPMEETIKMARKEGEGNLHCCSSI